MTESFSSMILRLEEMAGEREHNLISNEKFATECERIGEMLFLLAQKVRRGEV